MDPKGCLGDVNDIKVLVSFDNFLKSNISICLFGLS